MSNNTVTSRYADQFGKYVNVSAAQSMRDQYTREVERIRSDIGYTDAGRRAQIARVYTDTRHSLDAMRKELHDKINAHERTLTRQLFSAPDPSPAGLMAHRDARQRAAQLTSKDAALNALDVAHLDGDISLARAIAHHAHQNRWTEVLDAHTTAHPGVTDTLNELDNLPRGEAARIAEGNLMGIQTPKELRSMDIANDPLPSAERIAAQTQDT